MLKNGSRLSSIESDTREVDLFKIPLTEKSAAYDMCRTILTVLILMLVPSACESLCRVGPIGIRSQ